MTFQQMKTDKDLYPAAIPKEELDRAFALTHSPSDIYESKINIFSTSHALLGKHSFTSFFSNKPCP